MLCGATSKELLRLIKTKIGMILLSMAVLAIFVLPTFALANNTGMAQGQTTSNASSNMGTTGTAGSNSAVVNIMAKNNAFNMSTITVPAGAQVTVNFDNQDSGVKHNVAFYTDSSASTTIYKGQVITGPNKTTYTFTAPSTPGTHFFRCDIHPATMTGQFVVTSGAGSNTGSNMGNTSSSSSSSYTQ